MADPQHHVAGIVAALALSPEFELLGQVGGRLARQGRICGADAFAPVTVTDGAGLQSARCVTCKIEGLPLRRRGRTGAKGEASIIAGHGLALSGAQFSGDPAHLRMMPATVGIGLELPLKVAGVEPSEPRGARAVSSAIQPVTGKASVACARFGAAQGNETAVGRKAFERCGLRVHAAGRQQRCHHHDGKLAHLAATARRAPWFRAGVAPLLLVASACAAPPQERQSLAGADPARGKIVIERAGCGSCHTIPGLGWPQGKAGPRLEGLAARGLIAGRLPNRPDVLAAYVRNAPALVPDSSMPAMPITTAEARDVAAYLYEIEGD